MTDPDCIYCKIIDGELPSRKVYEDDIVLAFLDINPVRAGHTLVIPKNHSRTLLDMSEYDAAVLLPIAKRIAEAQKDALGAEGSTLIMNIEAASGQTVFHPHLHVIPRLEGDNLPEWPQRKYEDEDEADMCAEKIVDALN